MNFVPLCILLLLNTQEAAPTKPTPPESGFKLSVWREKPIAKIKNRDIKLGELLDYMDSHYAPGLNKDLDSAYGYFQIQSGDFDRWVDDYIDLQLLAPIAAAKQVNVSAAEIQNEARILAEREQKKQINKKKLDANTAAAVLPSIIQRTLRNQGLRLEKQQLIAKLFLKPFSGTELRNHFITNAHRFGGAVQVSQILFSVKDPQNGKRYSLEQRESIKKTAEELFKKLKEGGDFGEAAKLNSDDAASKTRNGDMGFIKRISGLPEPFTRAAFTTVPGQIVFIETEEGFHIVKVMERRITHNREFMEVRDEVENDYIREKAEKLLEELRADAKLVIY